MGKKGKATAGGLGKALVKDRFGSSRNKRNVERSMLHTAEVNDGYDWGRLNLHSVTEESSFEEFLSTAELAGTEFHAEKLNVKFVDPRTTNGLLSVEEKHRLLTLQNEKKQFLKIPRRPKWDATTSASELQEKEKEQFLEWRRTLASLQETDGLVLTPYEKNLEFWRQLWRVVERSDVLVQIVDARNPLLFRCEDLEKYATEIDPQKTNLILLNKADFLTSDQRQAWAKYFSDLGVRIAFFSAIQGSQDKSLPKIEEDDPTLSESTTDISANEKGCIEKETEITECNKELETVCKHEHEETTKNLNTVETAPVDRYDMVRLESSIKEIDDNLHVQNSSDILTRDQLISLFRETSKRKTDSDNSITTIGLVGYPNVGKSSTINALLMDKKVSVSATPGKTKHFQTLYLDKDLLLCDCPGLVMPSFVSTKAEMILNGILPIDQMRDHVPPIAMLATLIPRHVIEDTYGIMIARPVEGEDPDRAPTSDEILDAYGYNRGFMTQNGQPDNPRSSRYILKDFVNGKLLYCLAPPTIKQEEFHVYPARRKPLREVFNLPVKAQRIYNSKQTDIELDRTFFRDTGSAVHVRGFNFPVPLCHRSNYNDTSLADRSAQLQSPCNEKPWKMINKHANKKKREKTRRLYAYLDQH